MMDESEFLESLPLTCSICGNNHMHCTRCDWFCFSYGFHMLCNIVNPIKKHNNCNLVITFNSHLDTVLYNMHVFPPLQGWFSASLLSLNQSKIIYDKCNYNSTSLLFCFFTENGFRCICSSVLFSSAVSLHIV